MLYIAAGSKQYHGSLWYAVMAAEPLVDLIYVDTDYSNAALVRSLKQLHPGIILVPPKQRTRYLRKSDVILLGPGLGRTALAKQLVTQLWKHPSRPQKVVLDADALHYIPLKHHTKDTILTPHPGEYRQLFGQLSPEQASLKTAAVILAKGDKPAICQNGKCEYNTDGIAPFTKGGIGDVLAGVAAGLVCTRSAWSAAQLSSRFVAKALRTVWKRYGRYSTTSQVVAQLPLTYQRYLHP